MLQQPTVRSLPHGRLAVTAPAHRALGPRFRRLAVLAAVAALGWGVAGTAARSEVPSSGRFTNFETEPVRPLAMSPDGRHLFAVNTSDDRLEVYELTADGPVRRGEVVVGLRPVAVLARTDTEVWVSNHLSDSVSVVDVSDPAAPKVVRTHSVGDEPRDLVAAGPNRSRVFVATAKRDQPTAPGLGRAAVWVFDATNPARAPQVVTLFGTKARGLAVSADGSKVFAAIFHSGNQTTTIDERTIATVERATPTSGADVTPRPSATPFVGRDTPLAPRRTRATPAGANLAGRLPGLAAIGKLLGVRQQPTPVPTEDRFPAPPVSRIVQYQDGKWLDDKGKEWQKSVPFTLPDQDVFVIDAVAPAPAVVGTVAGVGTILFNLAVQPGSGEVWVTNTEARNATIFEPVLQGRAVESRLTRIQLGASADGARVTALSLNPRLADRHLPTKAEDRILSLSQPADIVFNRDGSRAYVAAFGSRKVGVLDRDGVVVDRFDVGFGPGGLALDEARGKLYVLNHLDASLTAIDLASRSARTLPLVYDPTPPEIRAGRPFLYDGLVSSSPGDQACASCHIFGDMDGLAWDLGNPQGDVLRVPFDLMHENFILQPRDDRIHPLKGPMVTQTFRGMKGAGPMHWRGDRFTPEGETPTDLGNFQQFRPAFKDLLGRDEPISVADMDAFGRFVLTMRYPPNPYQNLDRSMTPDQKAGADVFSGGDLVDSGLTNCAGCHTLPLGTNGLINFEGDRSGQDFKAPHMRNLYEKVGRFDKTGMQVSGFGFGHDGSTDTILNLVQTELFVFPGDNSQRKDLAPRTKLEAFLLAFDTGMAPAVGRQYVASAALAPSDRTLLGTLQARATAGDCDLTAHARVEGWERGWLLEGARFTPDRTTDAALSLDELVTMGAAANGPVMFLCVPPGDGLREALDRDLDGYRDADERAAGSDPADAANYPGHLPTSVLPPTPSPTVTPEPGTSPTPSPGASPTPSPTSSPTGPVPTLAPDRFPVFLPIAYLNG